MILKPPDCEWECEKCGAKKSGHDEGPHSSRVAQYKCPQDGCDGMMYSRPIIHGSPVPDNPFIQY